MKLATFETNKGTITAELYDTDAPGTVANFEKLANDGYYDSIRFHRPPGTGGPGWTIKCETKGNPQTHKLGALSMAHAGKDTGGSQFFMVLSEANTKHLNGVHTVFGQITGGLDVMNSITDRDHMVKVRVQ
jgi:peptidyl-prolyl cis-trans isomerase B (cyclophilin B)